MSRWRAGRAWALTSKAFQGYGVVKSLLATATANKCWYCETKVAAKYEAVEHYRPKSKADRGASHPRHGYWWLAWTWSNLLFACDDCNKSKGTRFPLAAGSGVLHPEEEPPGAESPLLIDPCACDPIDHIEFIPERDDRWRPTARNHSPRGMATIAALSLDGEGMPGVLDLYRDHVVDQVKPWVSKVRTAMESGRDDHVQDVWREACGRLLRRSNLYAALSNDALSVLVTQGERLRWRIAVPRPPL